MVKHRFIGDYLALITRLHTRQLIYGVFERRKIDDLERDGPYLEKVLILSTIRTSGLIAENIRFNKYLHSPLYWAP
jgi:hypothetical protein